VVVGTDGSEGAARAVVWAAEEAALRSRPLHIVHGTGIDPWGGHLSADTVQLILRTARGPVDDAAELARSRTPDLLVTTTVGKDSATGSLLRAAGEDGTIVVGSRGLGGFSSLLLGSVGLKVAGHASGPVVVVRGTVRPPAGVVLSAVRDEADLDAVRYAARSADRRKASLRLLSAWTLFQYAGSMVPMVDSVRAVAEEQASASTRIAKALHEEFPDLLLSEGVVKVPSPAGALVEASAHADLLVVGGHRPAHQVGASLGRVTHAVLHHAHCPVAVIPCR
jgi:nucleotide-binding universal stress UspA family protein